MGFSILSQPVASHNKLIAWVTGLLTLLLAVFAFILSFNALTDLATRHGISIPALFPLVVEAGVIIFSLNALYRSIHGESTKWQWSLIIGSSILSGMFNVIHAQPDMVSRVIAAMPSLFLLLSFETFLGQVKHNVLRTTQVSSLEQLTASLHTTQQELDSLIDTKQQEVDKLNTQAHELAVQIEQAQAALTALQAEIVQAQTVQNSSLAHARQAKAEQTASTIEQRRVQLVGILSQTGDSSVSGLAEKLHISRTTVYSDLDALQTAGVIHKNGQGWEVVR